MIRMKPPRCPLGGVPIRHMMLFGAIPLFMINTAPLLGVSLPVGEPVEAWNARSLSMAGTKVASSAVSDALSANPAGLALSTGEWRVEVSSGFRRSNRVETKEVFDTFDNTVGEATLGTDVNGFYQPVWGGGGRSLVRRGKYTLSLGAGVGPVYDFGSGHRREYRDDFYVKFKTDEYNTSGMIYDYAGVVSGGVADRAGLGVGYHHLRGSPETTRRLLFEDPTIPDTISTTRSTLSGSSVSVGAFVRTGFRLTWGGFYRSGSTLKGDFESAVNGASTSSTTRQVTYPSSYGVGVSYIPSNEIPSVFSLDVLWRNWSEYSDDQNDTLHLHDIVEYRLGVQHEMLDHLLVRFGFAYLPWQLNRDIALAQVSAGAGYLRGPLDVSIGAEMGKRTYKNTLIGDTIEPLTVDETQLRLLLTVSRTF